MRTMRKLAPFLCVAACAAGLYFWFEYYKKPLVRDQIETHLYTVRAETQLQAGKAVLAWGPLPASAFYPGCLAFASPDEAQEWLNESGKAQKGWHIYELSGDFNLDTHLVRGLAYTNKTLLVARELTPQSKD
jgi:hypothetical protein